MAKGTHPSAISDHLAEQICDAFGLFGEPEHCAQRLMRAHEEAGIEHVFLFPAHDMKTGYELPHAEVEAFGTAIRAPASWLLGTLTHLLANTPEAITRVAKIEPG